MGPTGLSYSGDTTVETVDNATSAFFAISFFGLYTECVLMLWNYLAICCTTLYQDTTILCRCSLKFLKMVNLMLSALVCMCVLWCFSHVRFFATLWTIARQAPLSMGFSKQEYWSGLPFLSPGELPNPGTKPGSPALAGGFFTTSAIWEACSFV